MISAATDAPAVRSPWAAGAATPPRAAFRPAACARTSCSSGGNIATMRMMVLCASGVCSVEMSRWPVSAAFMAVSIVSASRISPIRITSGSWRSAARSPMRKLSVSSPDLALRHRALDVAVQELDRVLERDDVLARAASLMCVDQRRHRARLARAGHAGHQHHAALGVRDLRRAPAAGAATRTSARRTGITRMTIDERRALPQDVHAEAPDARRAPASSRSRAACRCAPRPSSLRHQLQRDRPRLFGGQRLLRQRHERPSMRARNTSPALMWRSDAPRSTAALMIRSIATPRSGWCPCRYPRPAVLSIRRRGPRHCAAVCPPPNVANCLRTARAARPH